MAKDITNTHKELARSVARFFAVYEPPISRFTDEAGVSDVFVMEAADSPQVGVVSFSTIGLSDHPLTLKGEDVGVRVEIVGACRSSFQGFADAISTAAFCVINSNWFCAPGIIFPEIIESHKISETMSDMYFAHPFLWDDMKTVRIGGQDIAWLLAVPVSKAETEYAQRFGPEKLENLFEQKNVDIFDLNRRSVV